MILAIVGSASCKRDLISNPGQYAKVYMPQASESPAVRTFVMTNDAQTIVYGAAYGGVGYPDKDITVTFKVDNSLIQTFNSQNNTAYAAMPAGSYELEKLTAVIPSGKMSTDPMKIKVKTLGALEAFKQYLLPVTISADAALNDKLRTTYFLIQGQRDGISVKVMSFDKGSSVTNLNAVADIIRTNAPDLLLVKAVDINTNRSGHVDQPAALAQLIGMPNYCFATSIANFDGGQYGCVLYSRYPIVKNDTYILPTGDTNTEKGPLGVITLQINDTHKLVFAGTQLNSNATRRAAELPELLRIIQLYPDDPLILAGNFNDTFPAGSVYTGLTGLGFVFPCTTCLPNTPAAAPTAYSDFIMYKPTDRFGVKSYSLGATTTSTGLPEIVQLTMYY